VFLSTCEVVACAHVVMNALRATSHLGAAAVIDEDVYGRNSDVCYEDDLLLPGLGPGEYLSDDASIPQVVPRDRHKLRYCFQRLVNNL